LFDAPVRMACIPSGTAILHRIVGRPGPAPELGALVIRHCLLDLLSSIHDKRAVLNHGLANWTALEQ
jgi:hypothetical protein